MPSRKTPCLPTWARTLDLQPHPEGGWYRRTYRSSLELPMEVLPSGYSGARAAATAILFLLLPGEESAWHRVRSDKLWMHQRGGRLALALGGAAPEPVAREVVIVGSDPEAGECLQALVPGGVWQSARPLDDEPVLVGCVVTPGFDFEDFTLWSTPDTLTSLGDSGTIL